MTAQRRVLAGQGEGHVDDVADPQVFRLQDGRQHPVQFLGLEVAFPPQDREFLLGQEVNDLAAADDVQLVHGQRTHGRVPGPAHRAHRLQPLGRLDAHHGFGVAGGPVSTEVELGVHQQEAHRGAVVRSVCLEAACRLDPGRRRPETDLLFLGLGCRRPA